MTTEEHIAQVESRLSKQLKEAAEKIEEKVDEGDEAREGRITQILRQRNLAIATATICLVVAIVAVSNAITAVEARDDQVKTNRVVLCAQGRSTALAFREPQISATGEKETREHYLNRMVGQRALLLSLGGLKCTEQKGFATFPFLRGKALVEIAGILKDEAPGRFRRLIEAEHRGERELDTGTEEPVDIGEQPHGGEATAEVPAGSDSDPAGSGGSKGGGGQDQPQQPGGGGAGNGNGGGSDGGQPEDGGNDGGEPPAEETPPPEEERPVDPEPEPAPGKQAQIEVKIPKTCVGGLACVGGE